MPTTPELTSSETSPASDIAYDQHAVSTPYTPAVETASYSPVSTHNGAPSYNDFSLPQPPPLGLQLYVPPTAASEQEQPETVSKKRKNRDDDNHEEGAGKEKRPRVSFQVLYLIIAY